MPRFAKLRDAFGMAGSAGINSDVPFWIDGYGEFHLVQRTIDDSGLRQTLGQELLRRSRSSKLLRKRILMISRCARMEPAEIPGSRPSRRPSDNSNIAILQSRKRKVLRGLLAELGAFSVILICFFEREGPRRHRVTLSIVPPPLQPVRRDKVRRVLRRSMDFGI